VFAHPNWSIDEARTALTRVNDAAHALLLKSESEGSEADRRLVATGWDLGDLTRRYRRFVAMFGPVLDAITSAGNADLTAEAAFVIRTLLIHEYRKVHLQDPLLPPALLPADWVGTAAYEMTKRLYSVVFVAAESYLSNTASTLSEPLPAADNLAHARFGGLTPA